MSLESKDATCVGSLCERANSHGTRDFAGDTDLQAPFRNVLRYLLSALSMEALVIFKTLVILKALGVLGGFFVPSLTVNYLDGSD